MVSELRDPGTAVTATTVQATYRQLADTAVAALNCPARRTAESIALSATVAYRTVFDTVVTIPWARSATTRPTAARPPSVRR
jgi:hypothetical protein